MCQIGQCSDPAQPSYHVNGIPLEPGLIEVITTNTTAAGQHHDHLSGKEGRIAFYAWPGEPIDPATEYSGREWFLGDEWLPYQRDSFVTPAFPGYVSGHSAFSRAGAEVLTLMTGDAFFPGGMGVYTAAQGSLKFELGPSTNVVLQWGTYYDAADEAGVSRLYGGIHVSADDFPGRVIGSQVGIGAYGLAKKYFDGSIINEPFACDIDVIESNATAAVAWSQVRGMSYRVAISTNLLAGFSCTNTYIQAKKLIGGLSVSNLTDQMYFRIERTH
jgi:hypothetical protein